jgi:hypothetical protein
LSGKETRGSMGGSHLTMADDRRSARRVRLSGVRVAFESASAEVHEADVGDLSRDGLFIRSAPLSVGKRLSLEIKVAGEATPWSALGRIVWIRQVREGDDRPTGMAVKFIDIEETVVAAIERLIETRERTEPGLGENKAAAPPPREKPLRERTMIGVGAFAVPSPAAPAAPPASPVASPTLRAKAAALPLPATPAVPFVPSREKTMVGVGQDSLRGDPREPSLAIDLVTRKPPSTPPPEDPHQPTAETPNEPTAEAPQPMMADAPAEAEPTVPAMPERQAIVEREPSVSEPRIPVRRSGVGWLLVVVLIGGAAACYAFRDQLLPLWRQVVTTIMRNIR